MIVSVKRERQQTQREVDRLSLLLSNAGDPATAQPFELLSVEDGIENDVGPQLNRIREL